MVEVVVWVEKAVVVVWEVFGKVVLAEMVVEAGWVGKEESVRVVWAWSRQWWWLCHHAHHLLSWNLRVVQVELVAFGRAG